MKYYSNNTNETVRIKTWVLLNQLITSDSAKFLQSAGIKVRVDIEPQTINWQGKTITQFNGRTKIEFETTCKEHEMVLKLKYGKDILLVLDEMVLPNSFKLCTLSEINYNVN